MHVAGETRQSSDRFVANELSDVYYEQGGRADYVASILGTLTGLGALVVVAGLVAVGAAVVDFRPAGIDPVGAPTESFVVVLTGVAIVAFAALLVGGFAAGRMSRYSGGMNGFSAALWMLLLMVFVALAAWIADALNMLDRLLDRMVAPAWITEINVGGVLTSPRMVMASGIVAVALLLGGYVGGRLGERYHRRLDVVILDEAAIR